MRVILAGYNIDTRYIDDNSEFVGYGREAVTPETIAAANARISRDPRPIDELREVAINNIKKARESCENIVYGFGHASVAEHAAFNFDIIDVSRLCVENIQHSRLASFTEKSQRYQLLDTLTKDFHIPGELCCLDKLKFENYNCDQLNYYKKIYKKIRDHLLSKYLEANKEQKKNLKNKAKEDARYVTTLAMNSQMGMTANARTLESMITRLLSSYLKEENQLGQMLLDEAVKIAPSLVKFRGPTKRVEYDFVGTKFSGRGFNSIPQVRLVRFTQDADRDLICSIIFENSGHNLYYKCIEDFVVLDMSAGEKTNILNKLVGSMDKYSSVPREFEMVDFTFQVRLSASAFAQLKRHRIATILKKPYDVNLIPTCPQTIVDADALEDFIEATDNSYKMYWYLSDKYGPLIGDYSLCQAHNRVVLFKINARELYHFSRLRCDCHAQWEIREIADEIVRLAKEAAPLTCVAACGKDMFDEVKSEILREKNEDRKK